MLSCQVIDPYVKIEFHGIPADTASFKTKVVKDNGKKTAEPRLGQHLFAYLKMALENRTFLRVYERQ